ncbi:hypothetical protein M0R04_05630 [Candidatus Dojkabacteria bacterium]|jgi:hypothetical protein|nr:hypothetical protein [Candidatus Dojkabacteria bacterium]
MNIKIFITPKEGGTEFYEYWEFNDFSRAIKYLMEKAADPDSYLTIFERMERDKQTKTV